MHSRMSEHKVKDQVDHKCHYFRSTTKIITMRCPDSVVPEPWLKNHSVNCLLSDKDKQPCKDLLCLLFRALTMFLHGHSYLDAHPSQLFTVLKSKSGYDPKNFRGVAIDDLSLGERIVERNIFIYVFDIQEGTYIGELARWSFEKIKKTVKLLKFVNHIIHTNDIDCFLSIFDVPAVTVSLKYQTYSTRSSSTLKIDQKLFSNEANFDFESICVPTENLKAAETTFWIWKHVPTSI